MPFTLLKSPSEYTASELEWSQNNSLFGVPDLPPLDPPSFLDLPNTPPQPHTLFPFSALLQSFRDPPPIVYSKYTTTCCLHKRQEFFHEVFCHCLSISSFQLNTFTTIFNFLKSQTVASTWKDSCLLKLGQRRRFGPDSELVQLREKNVLVSWLLTVKTLRRLETTINNTLETDSCHFVFTRVPHDHVCNQTQLARC